MNLRRKLVLLKIIVKFYFLLLNTLLNFKCFNDQLCYCENRKEYLICKIKRAYADYEHELYNNMLDVDFLIECHSNLYHYLNQLFHIKNHCVCFILNNDYHYVGKDWFKACKKCLKKMDNVTEIKNEHIDLEKKLIEKIEAEEKLLYKIILPLLAFVLMSLVSLWVLFAISSYHS